jgi:hypothetical protein
VRLRPALRYSELPTMYDFGPCFLPGAFFEAFLEGAFLVAFFDGAFFDVFFDAPEVFFDDVFLLEPFFDVFFDDAMTSSPFS